MSRCDTPKASNTGQLLPNYNYQKSDWLEKLLFKENCQSFSNIWAITRQYYCPVFDEFGHNSAIFHPILTNLGFKIVYSSRGIQWCREIQPMIIMETFSICWPKLVNFDTNWARKLSFFDKIDFFFQYMSRYII